MKVYIQTNSNIPETDWGLSAYLGAKMLGFPIFLVEDYNEVPMYRNDLIYIADIDETKSYFNKINVRTPNPLNIPFKLNKHYHLLREMKIAKLGDLFEKLKQNKIPLPIFLKSVKLKQFEAGVINSHKTIEYLIDEFKDEDVLYSKALDLKSEWRCNIRNGIVESVNFYLGNPLLFPNKGIIESMIEDYDNSPVCYSLDVGITSNNETVLIECNDFWSIGNYGLEPKTYLMMLISRWKEICKI